MKAPPVARPDLTVVEVACRIRVHDMWTKVLRPFRHAVHRGACRVLEVSLMECKESLLKSHPIIQVVWAQETPQSFYVPGKTSEYTMHIIRFIEIYVFKIQ